MKCLCMEAENVQVLSAKQGISTTGPYGTIPGVGNGNLSHACGSLPKLHKMGEMK